MAVWAYASLMSLMHTLEMILHPSQQQLYTNIIQIESLLQKVRSLQEFLEDYSHRDHEEMAALGSRIADKARAADSVIDYHVLDQILARSKGKEAESSTGFSEYIQNLIEEMDDLFERIKETAGEARPQIEFSPAGSSRLAPSDHNNLVGSDEKLIKIMDTLTGDQSNCEIISIVGMGGIGKTTLAKNVYKNAYTAQHFYIRSWATVSQNYSASQIISDMLSEINRSKQESVLGDDPLQEKLYEGKRESDLSEYQLGDRLYKILFDRRYLIVIDDLWSIEAWEKIRAFLPDNGNGSRIIITTREINVARQLNSLVSFEMELLDYDQSWNLLRDKVFGKETCPPELEELGKDIAIKCRGLPLAIVAIGGFLAKSSKTREVWEDTMENLNSIISSGDEGNCMEILKLSYKNLPIHLKSCFLYIAVISEYRRSMIPDIAWLLVGEGFVKPIRDKTLEEVANEYITDLIERNLILVLEIGSIGQVKITGIHDFLGDICLKQVEEEKFLSAIDTRNMTVATAQALDVVTRAFEIRSTTNVYASRLVVWDGLEVVEELSPAEEGTSQLVPYLRLSFLDRQNLNSMGRRFFDSVPLFLFLQSLIVMSSPGNLIRLPSEIWDLPHLRHLFSNIVLLSDPLPHDYPKKGRHDPHILENLQNLVGAVDFWCGEDVYRRAPNLKMLKIVYSPLFPRWDTAFFSLSNLVHLQKLETLSLESMGTMSLNHLSFPVSLKKLTLIGCHLPDMTIASSLPKLEELGLHNCTFEGHMWRLEDEEFLELKKLVIGRGELLHWQADKTHFPALESLFIRRLNLEEFPEDFGELPTLRTIGVDSCSDSTNKWAEQIAEAQESYGNEGFQVIITRKKEDD
ncbi:putative late blight resistance protein homolog R1B-16 [Henckelia pumila]|uniref:putative late blight resistance protein homolog R1B-16 n=1 Tax=Henckelia pumila TaxID=405737 RepID=UPI003C6E17AC